MRVSYIRGGEARAVHLPELKDLTIGPFKARSLTTRAGVLKVIPRAILCRTRVHKVVTQVVKVVTRVVKVSARVVKVGRRGIKT